MSWSLHAAVHMSFSKIDNTKTVFKNPTIFLSSSLDKSKCESTRSAVVLHRKWPLLTPHCMANGDSEDEDEELCPVECVREIKKDEELVAVLEKAKQTKTLVVVDFYRTSCGSCKYIEQGFAKLCKGSGNEDAAVIFLKHNVIDEYDEQSDIAERLRIKTVPLFHFYKDGMLLEAFPTRDKERIKGAIEKYTLSTPPAPAAKNA